MLRGVIRYLKLLRPQKSKYEPFVQKYPVSVFSRIPGVDSGVSNAFTERIMRGVSSAAPPLRTSGSSKRHPVTKTRSQNKKSPESRIRNMPYDELSNLRRCQAERSVLIQVAGKRACDYVYKYCRQHGKVANMFYESHVRDYVLVEFESEEAALAMASTADHFETENVPIESRVLYLVNSVENRDTAPSFHVVSDGPREVNLSDLYNASSMREQMLMYYHAERLTDLETRLRYFVCSVLEDVLTPMFPLVEVLPYGSSANRLGRHRSDLDIMLNLNSSAHKLSRNSPFRYMTKIVDDDRHFTQRTLRVIADMLHLFVPHITQVQKIVHARVPIINFYHESTAITCDISLSNASVLTMSKILYYIGESDERFRPIMFALKKWAALNDLTLDRPGPRFSNFMLTMMVIAFLQTRSRPTVPPLSRLLQTGGSVDAFHLPEGDGASQADDLLMEFFSFYSDFDFTSNGVSIFHGTILEKPASSTLFIENPLDRSHNCAQNVHQKELEYLCACIRSTRDRLAANRTKSEHSWGLLTLVESRNFGTDVNVGVNVRNLFMS